MNQFPALVIGGPPHSGKSVLAHILTQKLRERNVDHYLLRSAPDGEGDWTQWASAEVVQEVRHKGQWSDHWTTSMCRDIANRMLPMLVDVGGKLSQTQETILDQCTYGLILTPNPSAQTEWIDRMQRHGLEIIADLHSDLHGKNGLWGENGQLRGTLADLERHNTPNDPVFDQLADWVAGFLRVDADRLRKWHFSLAPSEVEVVDIEAIIRGLYPEQSNYWLNPDDVPALLAHVPAHTQLAAYGRMPAFAVVALAQRCHLTHLFDPRRGWMAIPRLKVNAEENDDWQHNHRLKLRLERHLPDKYTLAVELLGDGYLDYEVAVQARLPYITPNSVITIDGRIPLWLFAAITNAYRAQRRIQVMQPSRQSQSGRKEA